MRRVYAGDVVDDCRGRPCAARDDNADRPWFDSLNKKVERGFAALLAAYPACSAVSLESRMGEVLLELFERFLFTFSICR